MDNDKTLMNAVNNDIPEDYRYADLTKEEILAIDYISESDFDYTYEQHRQNLLYLIDLYSKSDMQKVALEMANNFLSGKTETYSSEILNENISNHDESQRYYEETYPIINNWINEHDGNVLGLAYDSKHRYDSIMVSNMIDETKQPGDNGYILVKQPVYSDKTSGLGICVDGIYGNRIEITSYQLNGTSCTYTLKYTLYDIFGLDSGDIEDDRFPIVGGGFGKFGGFRSWYILQHSTEYSENTSKPFITYMEFERTVTLEIE